MRKILTIILSFALALFMTSCSSTKNALSSTINETPNPTSTTKQSNGINIGDYIQLGKYSDEPILWRCVDIDENGPLLLADKILTIKAFDAKGNHKYIDGTAQADTNNLRTSYGSNLWETSNIRSWLNSNALAGKVAWLGGCPPTADKFKYNSYANEKGFLAEGNFSINEQNLIKSVSQKSLINSIDVGKLSVGGTAIHKYSDNYIPTAMQNYDDAYYHNVVDKVFVLDIKQITRVYKNSSILGIDYYIARPTQRAVDNSQYKNSELSTTSYWNSLNRSPFTESDDPIGVRCIRFDGTITSSSASDDRIGVRPAFYINLQSVVFKSGNGSIGTPYMF